MKIQNKSAFFLFGLMALTTVILVLAAHNPTTAQDINPYPPPEPVKLVFIHHSVGENWLTDGNGDLGFTLGQNNYFVSDTNYGWGPDSIGDATDYPNWYDWFVGPERDRYTAALYAESGQNSAYTRPIADPGGENEIIIFKSCFPNSDLGGNPHDPPMDGDWYTVGHAKFVYNQILDYFITRPDKLFVALTPPPLLDPTNAANAREFSRWLVQDWLVENAYPLDNVAVWDVHNVLTDPDNHHRYLNGAIDYAYLNGPGTLFYDSAGDEHPNQIGNQKMTQEFVPMLNIFYNHWVANSGDPSTFADVPTTHPFWPYIQALWDAGLTGGCSTDPLMFCPDTILNRAMSAVFMLLGQLGVGYTPPAAPWDTFADDWSLEPWAEPWAEGMWDEGLTAGCSADPLMFCPWDQLPREQASVFGLVMKYGQGYTPPPATGTLLADVTLSQWSAPWTEQAYRDGLFPECGWQNGKPLFCPDQLVTRAWAAYLIVQAKNLPLP